MKVLLVNSNTAVGHGLALVLAEHGPFDVELVNDPGEVLPAIQTHQPALVIVDSEMPSIDYATFVARVKEASPGLGVVVASATDDAEDMQRALQAGVRAYLSVSAPPSELAAKLELAGQGHVVVSGQIASDLSGRVEAVATPLDGEADVHTHNLSEREMEVLACLARGATNVEIAERLVITENTVKVHVRNILRKLDLRNRQQAAAFALQRGLVEDVDFHSWDEGMRGELEASS